MNKVLVSIMVLSLVEAAGAEAGIWCSATDKAVSDNVLLTASAVTVFEIQDDASSAYVVCIEIATQPSDKIANRTTSASIADSLPEPMTIAMLGLCGFTLGRRNVRGLLLRNSRRY